jgi:hypothetical protein
MMFVGSPHGDGKFSRPQRPPGPPEALLDLYEHLLASTWSYGVGGGWPEVLPEQMPGNLPIDVPLPEGVRLVGSVRWTETAEVIFDSDMSRDEVVRFYEVHYLPLGWAKPESMFPGMGGGGFTNTGFPDFGMYFCKGDKDPWLHIRAVAAPGQPTSVYVSVSTNQEQSPCSWGQRREAAMMRHFMEPDILPSLRPPEGASQFGGGSSGGNGSYHSNAELRSNLGIEDVGDHYSAQLEAAGWTRTGSGSSGPLAWSAWDFKHEDEDWHGLFMALAHPWAEDEYKLLLETEEEGARRRREKMFGRF